MNEEFDKAFTKAIGQALEPPAKEAGEQLAKLINLTFTPLEIAKIYRDAWLSDFRTKIEQKFIRIPEDKIVSPPLNVIGPALESSKYHISSEELRGMFSNLIVHACNKDMESIIHPSYVTILTQLSPLEAQILAAFRPKSEIKIGLSISHIQQGQEVLENHESSGTGTFTFPEIIRPTANYYLSKNKQDMLVQSNIIEYDGCDNFDLISASISNLIRLGLIQTTFGIRVNDGNYDFFKNNSLYQRLQQAIEPNDTVSIRFIRGNMVGDYNSIKIEEGLVRLTQFGFNFISVCVIESEVI